MQYLYNKGIKIPFIFEENRDLPIVVLKLVFTHCGRSYDEIAGLARMFARILNEGVDDNFFKDLELRAINLVASSGFENLELSLSCLREHFEFSLKQLEKLLLYPRIEDAILKRLKIQALGELASKNNDFDYLAKKLLNAKIFNYKEFQSPNDGDEKSIAQISLQSLKTFYQRAIQLNNLVCVLGGALTKEEASKLLNSIFERLKIGTTNTIKKYSLDKNTKDFTLVRKESQQAYIYFASPFFSDFKDKRLHLAKIAFFILGQGGFGSRILEEIRVKRGLAYSAYAMLDMNVSFCRIFGYLQTKNESAREAKNIIKQLFYDFVTQGVSENELIEAKNFLIGSIPLRYESLNKRLSMHFNEYYQGLKMGYFKQELKLIKEVKLEQLNAYIQQHAEIVNLSFVSVANEDQRG